MHYLILIFFKRHLVSYRKKLIKYVRYKHFRHELYTHALQDMNTWTMRYEYLHDKVFTTMYEYLHDEQLESMSSWISFERENYVEDVHGFRFANFLIYRHKILLRLNGEKNPTLKICRRCVYDVSSFFLNTWYLRYEYLIYYILTLACICIHICTCQL